jgi:predicted ATPase
MVLARLYPTERKRRAAAARAETQLDAFGKYSGLFQQLSVERKGAKQSDPFQILVGVEGRPRFNLTDVGYGVSQVLPIAVDAIFSESRRTFLLQQPEVHLHPRAQAALASLFVELVRADRKRFLIETHSDYLLDRLRFHVRQKDPSGLQPDDVSVLYFERHAGSVRIHPMRLDEAGNIVGAPPTYRQFFLEEERSLFGV